MTVGNPRGRRKIDLLTLNVKLLMRMTVEVVGHGFLGSSKLLIFFPYSVKF